MSKSRSRAIETGLAVAMVLQGLALAAFGLQMFAWSAGVFSLCGAAAFGFAALVLLGRWPSAARMAATCAIVGALAVGFIGLVLYVVGSCGSIVNCGGREPAYFVLVIAAVFVIADVASAVLLWRRAPNRQI